MISMKKIVTKSLLTAVFCSSITLHAAATKDAALAAATSWLAILDTTDYTKASSGLADEVQARFNLPSKDEDLHSMNIAVLNSDKRYPVFGHGNTAVTRTLQPDGVKQVTSCNCGIRDGVFFTFTYDVKYNIKNPAMHMSYSKAGTDVVFMLLEPDGSWKPAAITSQWH
jgi:hypothetical protein